MSLDYIHKSLNTMIHWLVVSTPLKNMIVKMGSSSPIFEVKIPKCLKPPTTQIHLNKAILGRIPLSQGSQNALGELS